MHETRRRSAFLATGLAWAGFACADPSAGETGEETASSDTADEDTGSTTGDEGTNDTGTDSGTDSDTGEDPPVLCDVATVETRTPEWVELLPQPAEGRDTAGDVAITAEGIFVGLTRVVDNVYAIGLIERRGLDGSFEWGVEVPGYRASSRDLFAWDGAHLYYEADGLRRMTSDGAVDEGWWGTPISPDADFHEMNVDGPLVVAAGSWSVEEHPKELPETWSEISGIAKDGAPGGFGFDPNEGEPNRHVGKVASILGVGYVAAIQDNYTLLIRGMEGAPHQGTLSEFDGQPSATLLDEHPEGLLVGGWSGPVSSASSWTRVIDPSGAELWRHALEPCGVGVSTFVAQFARDEGRIVGIAYVDIGETIPHSIVVELDLDGELVASYAVEGIDAQSSITGIDVGEGMVAITAGQWAEGEPTTWVARLP